MTKRNMGFETFIAATGFTISLAVFLYFMFGWIGVIPVIILIFIYLKWFKNGS